jgi:hypothetical protein
MGENFVPQSSLLHNFPKMPELKPNPINDQEPYQCQKATTGEVQTTKKQCLENINKTDRQDD